MTYYVIGTLFISPLIMSYLYSIIFSVCRTLWYHDLLCVPVARCVVRVTYSVGEAELVTMLWNEDIPGAGIRYFLDSHLAARFV